MDSQNEKQNIVEFVAKAVQDFLKDNAISYFSTQNQTKANYADWAIKTIKSKLFKYMYANQPYKYRCTRISHCCIQ